MSQNCSADKHHAYLLGISLYLAVTGQGMDAMKKNQGKLSFDLPEFKTTQGQPLRQLIEGLLKTQPEERLGLEDAKRQLAAIEQNLESRPKSAAELMSQYKAAVHEDRPQAEPGTLSVAPDTIITDPKFNP